MATEKKQIPAIDDNVLVWIEQGAIHMKISENHKDPVELSVDSGKKLAQALLQMCQGIESGD